MNTRRPKTDEKHLNTKFMTAKNPRPAFSILPAKSGSSHPLSDFKIIEKVEIKEVRSPLSDTLLDVNNRWSKR